MLRASKALTQGLRRARGGTAFLCAPGGPAARAGDGSTASLSASLWRPLSSSSTDRHQLWGVPAQPWLLSSPPLVQHIHTARGTCSTELLESQAPTQLGAGDGCCGQQPEPAAHDAPGCTASHTAASDAAGLSPLRSVLESCGLGFPALMAVLKYGSKQNLDADRAGSHVQQLQQWLGPDMVNQMLLLAPLLVDRSPALLQKHYSGLTAVLGGDASLVQAVVRKLPDILNHSPDAISSRVAALQDIFQVSRSDMLQLLQEAPVLLRRNPSRVSDTVQYLQQAAGLRTAQHVFKVLCRWPIMASTEQRLLEERHRTLQVVLRATPAEMCRVCSQAPVLLSRDPSLLASFVSEVARHLQMPLDDLAAVLRQRPEILSWNASTVISRITVVCQTLRLPHELRPSLLDHNKRLLIHHTQVPQRVEWLKTKLALAEAELLPLLHTKVSVLWLPAERMEAKLATAASLAKLSPAWLEAYAAAQPQQKLRVLQASAACLWRLAYLAHTAQQACWTFHRVLNASTATFQKTFPGFQAWLDRYNSIVRQASIPLVPAFTPPGAKSPAAYMAVTAGTSTKQQQAAGHSNLQQRRPAVAPSPAVDSRTPHPQLTAPRTTGSSTGSSDCAVGALPWPPQGPPTSATMLAAWWGMGLQDVNQLLFKAAGRNACLSMGQWQERLLALQQLLDALGWLPPADGKPAGSAGDGTCSSMGGSTASIAASTQQAGSAQQQAGDCQWRQHGQQLALSDFDSLLQPEARAALQHAVASGQAAAVAAVSVASHLAPFSQQLQQLPPRPPAAVLKFVQQHPQVLARRDCLSSCRVLLALITQSQYLQDVLRQHGAAGLAQSLNHMPARYKLLQYLVHTGQPPPWQVAPAQLLSLTAQSQSGRQLQRLLLAAYPDYKAWRDEVHKL